ncbi:uncharacterized protein LOC136067466 [Quercus suber]|uniref:uncharacterized protein LOC136067466 n=1 Tax=Quercus suber TaxID=58331 RepID=UPI0032E01AAC
MSKDTLDSRSRCANTTNRGGRGGADCYVGRGGSSQSLVVYMLNLHTRRKIGHMLMQSPHLIHSAWQGNTRVDDLPHTGTFTFHSDLQPVNSYLYTCPLAFALAHVD